MLFEMRKARYGGKSERYFKSLTQQVCVCAAHTDLRCAKSSAEMGKIMRNSRKIINLFVVLILMLTLAACRVGAESYELTNYMGKPVATFAKKSGTKLDEQSNGVYVMKDVVQIMAADDKVNSVTLLKNADKYTVYGIEIGMSKEDADLKLAAAFGKETASAINSDKNSITYSYLKNDKELHLSCDIDTETVVELSYYITEGKQEEEDTKEPENAGQLIAIIGKTRVYYNEVMVYLKSIQESYEADYGKGIWEADILGNGSTFGNMIKDEVMNQITELKIIRAEAEKLGVVLAEEELAEAKSYAREHYDGLTQEDRQRYLITEELLQQVYADNLLADKVFENLTINVDTNVPDEEAKQITVQDILIYSVSFDEEGNKVELSTKEKEDAYEKVKNLLEKAKETEDFYALAESNSKAEKIEYTFGKGQGPKGYSAAFEQAAFSLSTGQVSNIITTDYGWHIIYCVTDFNEDATIQVKENIIEERRNRMFSELYTEWSAEYDIVINHEAWGAVTFTN